MSDPTSISTGMGRVPDRRAHKSSAKSRLVPGIDCEEESQDARNLSHIDTSLST